MRIKMTPRPKKATLQPTATLPQNLFGFVISSRHQRTSHDCGGCGRRPLFRNPGWAELREPRTYRYDPPFCDMVWRRWKKCHVHAGLGAVSGASMPGGALRFALPRYALDELRSEPSRLLEYLQAPPTDDTQRLALTAADLGLLPLLDARVDGAQLDAAAARAAAENDEAMQALNTSENELRTRLAAALHEEGVDEDLAEPLHRFAHDLAAAQRPAKSPQPRTRATPHADALGQLYIARTCTQLLAEADDAEAAAHASPDDAGVQMASLQRLASFVTQVPRSENAAASVGVSQRATTELTRRRDALYTRLTERYHAALRDALRDAHWPPPALENPDAEPEARDAPFRLVGHAPLEDAWTDVCELQLTAATLGLCAAPSCLRTLPLVSAAETTQGERVPPGSDAYVPLTAAAILFQPILLRFRYHFDGERATNRLDKPEWFLRHMLALVQRNAGLFAPAPDVWSAGGDVCALTRRRRPAAPGQPLRERHVAVDTASELLHNILAPLRRKIHASMPLLAAQPALLAHNLFQYLSFDTDLRDVYPLARTAADGQGAVHLANDVLGNDTYFQQWLDGERVFAQRRFEAVLESPAGWALVQADTLTDLDDPSLEAVSTQDAAPDAATNAQTTTRSACTLMHILAGVTERYQPLHSLGQRCAFILRVQRPLLTQLAVRLVRHLDAFENLSGAFSRAIPGEISALSTAPGNDAVRGTRGITRVAKALLSAEYVRQQLEEWSDSSFFLSMHEELAALDRTSTLYRLMLPSHASDELDSASLISALKRGLQRGANAAATLRPLAPSATLDAESSAELTADEPAPGIWDGMQAQFADISERSKRALERLVVSEVLEQLRPYILRYVRASHTAAGTWTKPPTPSRWKRARTTRAYPRISRAANSCPHSPSSRPSCPTWSSYCLPA